MMVSLALRLRNLKRSGRFVYETSRRWMTERSFETAQGYDVVIIGAGMVGAALASSLKSGALTSSLKIALLDAKVLGLVSSSLILFCFQAPLKTSWSEVPEIRVSTLTPASVEILQKCRAWDALAPPCSAPVEAMQVWDYSHHGYLRWSARQVGYENMGVVAENCLIKSALLESLKDSKNVDFRFPVAIESVSFPSETTTEDDRVRIRLESGEELRCRLIVGADGAQSKIRTLARIKVESKDYHQRGSVATVEVSEPNRTAWQRFLPTGPFALLPVKNGYFNVVWSTTESIAKNLEYVYETTVREAFNEALHGEPIRNEEAHPFDLDAFQPPPRITKVVSGQPRSFSLKRQFAERWVGARMALIGDAARVIHPLAGQGVNLGFADVKQLTKALTIALQTGQDIGDRSLLQMEYERVRKTESKVMMMALDTIRDVFGIQSLPFQSIRGFGMNALNVAKPIKNEIMLYAMGLKSLENLSPLIHLFSK